MFERKLKANNNRGVNLTYVLVTVITLITLATILFISYNMVKKNLMNRAEQFGRISCKNSIGIMMAYDKLYQEGKLTLDEAQTAAKEALLGPMKRDGTRDLTKSLVGANHEVYTYALTQDGNTVMHPFYEGVSSMNIILPDGKRAGDILTDPKHFEEVTEYPFYNPDTKKTGIAYDYRMYFEPWKWIVGYGDDAEVVYKKPLEALRNSFIGIFTIFFVISLLLVSMIKKNINKSIEEALDEESYDIR
jgi:signal transduction histidine kinase